MKKSIFFLFGYLLVLIVFFQCKKNNLVNGYSKYSEGLYHKLLAFGDGQNTQHAHDVLIFDAVIRTNKDSIFWQSNQTSQHAFIVNLMSLKSDSSLYNYFSVLSEGDSVSIMMSPRRFFRMFFDTIAPDFTLKDTILQVDLRLNQFISMYEYEHNYATSSSENLDKELPELKSIEDYLLSQGLTVKPDVNGIYWINYEKTNNSTIQYGNIITVELKGSFLNGNPITSNAQKMTFAFGTPDQVVKGLNIVIAKLKKGEIAKIILPSRLAFGEKGSSNGVIQPYTPLIYELTITDIK